MSTQFLLSLLAATAYCDATAEVVFARNRFQFNIPAIARHTSVIGDCIRSFSATTGLATSRATCSQAKIVKAFQYFSWGKAHLQRHKIQHQLLAHERSIALIVSFVNQTYPFWHCASLLMNGPARYKWFFVEETATKISDNLKRSRHGNLRGSIVICRFFG